jgi:hypothetical protein
MAEMRLRIHMKDVNRDLGRVERVERKITYPPLMTGSPVEHEAAPTTVVVAPFIPIKAAVVVVVIVAVWIKVTAGGRDVVVIVAERVDVMLIVAMEKC